MPCPSWSSKLSSMISSSGRSFPSITTIEPSFEAVLQKRSLHVSFLVAIGIQVSPTKAAIFFAVLSSTCRRFLAHFCTESLVLLHSLTVTILSSWSVWIWAALLTFCNQALKSLFLGILLRCAQKYQITKTFQEMLFEESVTKRREKVWVLWTNKSNRVAGITREVSASNWSANSILVQKHSLLLLKCFGPKCDALKKDNDKFWYA